MKLRDTSLQVYEENSFTYPFMYFTFIFSECITITSPEESLKVCECNFFQRKVVLLVIYLFNHDSSKSTIFMLNIAFDVLLSAVFVKYNPLESFVSCKLFALCFHMYFFIKSFFMINLNVIITFMLQIYKTLAKHVTS